MAQDEWPGLESFFEKPESAGQELSADVPAGLRRRAPRLPAEVREESARGVLPGWPAVTALLLCLAGMAAVVVRAGQWPRLMDALPGAAGGGSAPPVRTGTVWMFAGLSAVLVFVLAGLIGNREGTAVVLTRWGRYRGTLRRTGLSWVPPTLRRRRVVVRLRHWRSEQLPAADREGFPLLATLLVVWRVKDTARALFAVGGHEEFLRQQSAAALCRVAAELPCDRFVGPGPSLRDGGWFGEELTRVLAAEMAPVGVEVFSVQPLSLEYGTDVAATVSRRRTAELDAGARATAVVDAVETARSALDRLRDAGLVDDGQHDADFARSLVIALMAPGGPAPGTGRDHPDPAGPPGSQRPAAQA